MIGLMASGAVGEGTYPFSPWGFAAFFVTIWVLVSFVISGVGGWRELATVYGTDEPLPGIRILARHVSFGTWGGYNNAVNLWVSDRGLGLSVIFLLRIGHSPLLIPWPEITAEPREGRFLRRGGWVLRFARASGIEVFLPTRVADKVIAVAGRSWPGREAAGS